MIKQEDIAADIERLDEEIAALRELRRVLVSRLDKLYYVANIKLDAPVIICHGTEDYCRQYMLEHYPQGEWYSDSTQFSPIDNPERINWAILHSLTKAEKKNWERMQAYIKDANQDTARQIIAMLRGD